MAAADERAPLAGGILKAGSTTLGTALACAAEFVGVVDDIRAEEYGGELVDQIYLCEEWIFVAAVANFDADARDVYFPNSSSGVISYPGAHKYGSLRSDDAVVLTLTPYDNSLIDGFKLWNAVPLLARPLVIPFSSVELQVLEAAWIGLRDSSNRVMTTT